jgi:hypothetical protein
MTMHHFYLIAVRRADEKRFSAIACAPSAFAAELLASRDPRFAGFEFPLEEASECGCFLPESVDGESLRERGVYAFGELSGPSP